MSKPYQFTNPTTKDLETAYNYSKKLTKGINLNTWKCPSCNRNKDQIICWYSTDNWGFSIVRHHDHAAHQKEIINGRFPVTLICHDCNMVDVKIKNKGNRQLKHKNWSFSPEEIKQVITPVAHQKHKIDVKKGIALAKIIID